MDEQTLQERLSVINTRWTLLRQAHGASGDASAQARAELMQRYSGAIYRYLLAGVRDPDVADDLSQEFAVRFLEGRFHKVDPTRGRFRDYVKTCLFHLVSEYHRRQGKQPRPDAFEDNEPAVAAESFSEEDRAFRASWRAELIERTWRALAQVQEECGQPYYQFLRFRFEHEDLSSEAMAEMLSEQLNRKLTAAGVRQILHRARERFADLLLEEVRQSLGPSGRDHLEEELAELELLKYCRNALGRRTP
jgi:RNA polymerase sigma-70 factor (ECF subfamily)